MPAKIETVGVIGLGKMGLPMSRHMIAQGYKVTGFDVRPQARQAAQELGVAVAETPALVARASQLTIVVVGFDSDVETALFADGGVMSGAQRGAIVAIASTVAPETMKKIAKRLEGSGVALIDAPLCRGEPAAEAGKLLVMGGGDKEAFEAARPCFACWADDIFHLGDVGAGQVGKMVNNMILWACICADFEGLDLGQKLGVERGPLREALVASSANNWALETEIYNYPFPWAEKDMSIVSREADAARISLPVAGVVKEAIKALKIARGEGMPETGG